MKEDNLPPNPIRRSFLKKACTVAIGAAASLAPGLAGIWAFQDPLRRKSNGAGEVLVASLDSLPEDGVPRKFSVVANYVDAWTRTPNVPIGAVYLRRTGEKTVQAFNVVCPHAGCFVDYNSSERQYLCPCHNSSFALDGRVNDPRSPSPRGLDQLKVEIRNGTEIWVAFQNFRAGLSERIPVS